MAGNNLLKQLLSDIEKNADQARQLSQERRLSMYLDDYEDIVIQKLKTQFHKDNYDRLYPMFATYYNLFKKIINLKSVIYKREATRTWYKRGKENKPDEKYNDIIANSNINSIMPTVNVLTNVNNTSFVRIMSNTDRKIMQYESVPSENISLIQNPENPTDIQALLHMVTIKDSNTSIKTIFGSKLLKPITNTNKYIVKYFYWDKDYYIILDANKKVTSEIDNPYKDKNGNGIIPYTLFTNIASIAGSIWNETVNSDLYDGTVQVNIFQTYLNNLIKLAGYRQIYLTGIAKDEVKNLSNKTSDALQPIVLTDSDSKIGQFELTSKIKDVQDAIHDIISEIADNHGVEFSSRVSSAQKMSGIALRISKDAINDLKEEQQPFYRDSETELAEKTMIIANQDLKAGIDIEGKFSVDFYQDTEQIETTDKIKIDTFHLKNNLKSLTELYRDLDPDTDSDEEALKRIQQNKEINDTMTDLFPFMPIEDDENAEGT